MSETLRRAAARLGLLSLTLLLAGCYHTGPELSAAPSPGARIVAELTPEGRDLMAPMIGADALLLEGVVAVAERDEWELLLRRVEHRDQAVLWNSERVRFPESAFSSVRERRFDTTRSLLLAGAITTAALVLGRMLGLQSDGGENGGTGPEPVH